MKVRYTPAALAEREAIFEYLNERSPQAARGVVRLIAHRIAELAEHPRKGHPIDREGIYSLWIARAPIGRSIALTERMW